jgi:hypothetical protein
MASLKRRRPEKWTVLVRYPGPKMVEYRYDTVEGACGFACRVAGDGHRVHVLDPENNQVAEFKPRRPRPKKIDRDPNLGPNLQRAAEERRQVEKRERLRRPGPKPKRTLTRRKA